LAARRNRLDEFDQGGRGLKNVFGDGELVPKFNLGTSPAKIRHANPNDAAEIFAVHASNDDPMQWDDLDECREYIEWMAGLETPPIVAEFQNKIVGDMTIWWGQDVPELGRSLDISTLYIHREHHRQGAGSALIQQAAQIAGKHNCKSISVRPNSTSIEFYEKTGFAPKLHLQEFLLTTPRFEKSAAFEFRQIHLATLAIPEGSFLQTWRILHPKQLWNSQVWLEANPPLWRGTNESRRVIFAYSIDSEDMKADWLAALGGQITEEEDIFVRVA
jgi:GNAT superfamily N-acetyltransferase